MQRSISTWMACKPSDMAHNQSREAIQCALEDMRADILSLHDALDRLTDAAESLHPFSGYKIPERITEARDYARAVLERTK